MGVVHAFGGSLESAVPPGSLHEPGGRRAEAWAVARQAIQNYSRQHGEELMGCRFRPYQVLLVALDGEAPDQIISRVYQRTGVKRDGSYAFVRRVGGSAAEHQGERDLVRASVVLEAHDVDESGVSHPTGKYYLAVEKYPPRGRGQSRSIGGGTVLTYRNATEATLVCTEDVECSAVVVEEGDVVLAMALLGTGSRWKKLHTASARLMGAVLK